MKYPLLFLSSRDLECEVPSFWNRVSDHGAHLPQPADMVRHLPSGALEHGRIGFALEERYLNPIRVAIDKKLQKREIESYLLWKLKKILPYPVDQVTLRYRLLRHSNTFLALTLPKNWVQSLYSVFAEAGVKCGFIGGIFHLITEHPKFRDQAMLCLFHHSYSFCSLERNGELRDYRHRRLPFNDTEDLDVAAMAGSDLANILEQLEKDRTLWVLNLSPGLDHASGELAERLHEVHPAITRPPLSGGALERFRSIIQD